MISNLSQCKPSDMLCDALCQWHHGSLQQQSELVGPTGTRVEDMKTYLTASGAMRHAAEKLGSSASKQEIQILFTYSFKSFPNFVLKKNLSAFQRFFRYGRFNYIGGMIYCHSKVFMVQATRLYSLICNLVDTCGLFRCT